MIIFNTHDPETHQRCILIGSSKYTFHYDLVILVANKFLGILSLKGRVLL